MQRNHAMFMATLSARANRFDEMIAYLKKVIQHPVELNREEMQIVAFGCKNAIDGRRDSIAGITKYESLLKIEWKNKEVDHFCTNEVDKTKTVALQKYKEEIANELTVICHQVIELVDECRQNSRSRENITNYYQIRGDCFRYLAQLHSDQKNMEDNVESAYRSYSRANKIANELDDGHPTRIILGLNYSVFVHDILNNREQALVIANEEYSSAIKTIDYMPDEHYKEATVHLRCLLDNIRKWEGEKELGVQQGKKSNGTSERRLSVQPVMSRRESCLKRRLVGKMVSTADVAPIVPHIQKEDYDAYGIAV